MLKLIHNKIGSILPKIAIFSIIWIEARKTVNAQALRNPLGSSTTFADVMLAVARIITQIGIWIVGIFIIYAGFLFVSARGNSEQIQKAKTTFFWTIIGAIILIGAWAIATALRAFLRSLGS